MDKVPYFYFDDEERHRKLANAINILIEGGSNAIGEFTVSANTSITIITDSRCGEDCHIDIIPLTANAASALSVTYLSPIDNGEFTVNHGNNAGTDRTYSYAIRRR